jgi:exopolysaccharide biosynthesis polyprenyl glycosylphosphotransferase
MTFRIRIARPWLHAILIAASFYAAYLIRLKTDLIPFVQLGIPPIAMNEMLIYGIIAIIIFWLFSMVKKLYDLNKIPHNYFTLLTKVWLYWLVVMTFIAYFGQGFIFIGGISRFIIITGAAITGIIIASFDRWRNHIEKRFLRRSPKKILLISDNREKAEEIIEKLQYHDRDAEIITIKNRDKHNHNSYHTILAIGIIQPRILQNIMDTIRLSKSRFLHLAEWYFLEDIVYTTETLWPIVALEYKDSTLDGRSRVFKRIFDIGFSLFVIIISSPIMLLVALVIKLTSPGPVFYVQKRVGKHGRPFTFLKFRTMYTHLSTGPWFGWDHANKLYQELIQKANTRQWVIPKIANDPRITPIGKFLRKTSIDELPQFFLSLRGTISVVWPRPHLPNEVENYDIRHTRLLSIKPGITGYAQIFGRHKLNFDQEAKLDLYYIQHRSIRLDLYVIIMTIKVLFQWK